LFSYQDAFQSKYYFDRLRQRKNIPFHWHYNILEAVIKNAYIVQQVQKLNNDNKIYNILDLGCGSGHVSMAIGRVINAQIIGFDLNINWQTRLDSQKYNLKNYLTGNTSSIKIFKCSHVDFFTKHNDIKFDIIIDNCSVTHFDTKPINGINIGWRNIIENLSKNLKTDGKFVCATDVGTTDAYNSEFCKEEDLIRSFSEFGWEIENQNKMQVDKASDTLLSKFLNPVYSQPFLRLPPPNTLNDGVLGIIGFVARKK
jgi:SAM-dependent methyltransferase